MSAPRTAAHNHLPLYRVVRRGWDDPLNTSFSQRASANNRWNTEDFPALYCSCSERVARAITLDLFRFAAIDLADLQDAMLPQLTEISWTGEVVDMASAEAILAAGFQANYPVGVDKTLTRAAASQWHSQGVAGVLARSASLMRLGFNSWHGGHEPWGEVTVYVGNAPNRPTLLNRRTDLSWFTAVETER